MEALAGMGGYAASIWSLIYGALGVYWTLGGAGFPFGRANDPQAVLSILSDVQAQVGAPVLAGLGLLGALLALVMNQAWRRRFWRAVLLTLAWTIATALAVVIPDYRVLMAVAYAPLFVIGAPFGWPPGNFFDVITWPIMNQLLCLVGGLRLGRRGQADGEHQWL